MTRKRRISEAAPICNIRDPLNLKEVSTDNGSYPPEDTFAKIANVNNQHAGDRSQNTKGDDSKLRHESLSHHKSLNYLSPRVIRPLLARNPKDPLDLLSSGRSEEANIGQITRTHKVPSPIVPSVGAPSHPASQAEPLRQSNSRKRRRNRSFTALSDQDSSTRPNASKGESPVSNSIKAFTSPPSSSKSCNEAPISKAPKKPRRSKQRKRKRRHGKSKKACNATGSEPTKATAPEQGEKKKKMSSQKRPPTSSSPLAFLCSPLRPIFFKSKVLHIGSCGDNGSFSIQLRTQYGANRVVGLDRNLKRVRIARRTLGSWAGVVSLVNTSDKDSTPPFFPRCFPMCFGPVGPNIESPMADAFLRSVEFLHVPDYASINSSELAAEESPLSQQWDVVVLQESVLISLLTNSTHGPTAVHQLLTRVSNSVRTGGHLILVIGRLRWQRQLRTFKWLATSQSSSVPAEAVEGNTDTASPIGDAITAAGQLHPLNQLRKFFRFRLLRRITSPLPVPRQRQPSVLSLRGISPFQSKHSHRHHSHAVRPQSLLSTSSSYHAALATDGNKPLSRRHGGSHRIVFVLQKKSASEKNSNETVSPKSPKDSSS